MTEERGYRGMKLKTWKRSMEDIEMVAEVRKLLPKAVIYVDGNGIYTESETRTILVHVKDYNVVVHGGALQVHRHQPAGRDGGVPAGRAARRPVLRIARRRCMRISARARSARSA